MSFSSLCHSQSLNSLNFSLSFILGFHSLHQVNLNILQERLAEAHAEHLERGCRLKPEFSVQNLYKLKALYITCEACNTFEVVV